MSTSTNLMELLQQQLLQNDTVVETLSQQLGGVEKEKAATAAQTAITALVTSLAKNATRPENANGLLQAIDRDHDGSLLDHAMEYFSGQFQPSNPKTTDGAGILRHLLGDRKDTIAKVVAETSGLEPEKGSSLLEMLAPVVMGALGKTRREAGFGLDDIVQMLTGTVQQQKGSNPAMDMITRFLDQDGDGSAMDDIAGMGMRILGNLFGGKK